MLDFLFEMLKENKSLQTIVIILFLLSFLFIVGIIIWLIVFMSKAKNGACIEFGGHGKGFKLLTRPAPEKQSHTEKKEPPEKRLPSRKEKESRTKSSDSKIPLIQHSLFINLSQRIRIDCFEFTEYNSSLHHSQETEEQREAKKCIARIFLQECNFKVFYKNLDYFVKDLQANDGADLHKIGDLICDCVKEYEGQARGAKIELPNGRSIYGVPEAFIQKFSKWNNNNFNIMLDKVQNIIYSAFYESWEMKLIVILDIMDIWFDIVVSDANKTLIELNGEVNKEIRRKLGLPEE